MDTYGHGVRAHPPMDTYGHGVRAHPQEETTGAVALLAEVVARTAVAGSVAWQHIPIETVAGAVVQHQQPLRGM